jgi:hypothetical protein
MRPMPSPSNAVRVMPNSDFQNTVSKSPRPGLPLVFLYGDPVEGDSVS